VLSGRRVGVLALQGAFVEHRAALKRLGVDSVEVRWPQQLGEVDGLIIPGGESTTISKLMDAYHLRDGLVKLARAGFPIWGTCAGMILLANDIRGGDPGCLGLISMSVRRTAFGRQVESFRAGLAVPILGEQPFPAMFIRAPFIERVGPDVEVLATLDDGTIVAVRQGRLLATAFHPELTDDLRFHRYFAASCQDRLRGLSPEEPHVPSPMLPTNGSQRRRAGGIASTRVDLTAETGGPDFRKDSTQWRPAELIGPLRSTGRWLRS
jgi:5'-phosphate synthase pdxT subunit